jgi:hypothetical protein
MARHVLISLIGAETIPNFRMYKELQPDVLIHLYSDRTTKQNEILKSMINSQACVFHEVLVEAENMQHVKESLEQSNLILGDDDVTINITGGNKIMALAMISFFNAIGNKQKRILYIDLLHQLHLYMGESSTIPEALLEELSMDELIKLKGQVVKSFVGYDDMMNSYEASYREIKSFNTNSKIWNNFFKNVVVPFQRYKEKNLKSKLYSAAYNQLVFEAFPIFFESKLNSPFHIEWTEDDFVVYYRDVMVCHIEDDVETIIWLIFKSGWFELFCAEKLRRTYPLSEIWLNVVFKLNDVDDADKNEVDIILKEKNRLILVECKSGNVTSMDIDKMVYRRNVYAGIDSRNFLALQFPLSNKVVKQKCMDSGIEVMVM